MRFARWSFGIAAAYGLVATLGLYFRGALTPESLWLFVFAGAAAATQLLYVALAIAPERYWRLIPIGIASKLSFGIPVMLLHGKVPPSLFAAGLVDLALAVLFAIIYARSRKSEQRFSGR